MNDQQRAAMQMALSDMEKLCSIVQGISYDDDEQYQITITALREALKQERVACEQCEELSVDKARWYRMADMFAQQAQELKDVLRQALNLIESEWPKGDEVAQPVVDKIKKIVGERHDR